MSLVNWSTKLSVGSMQLDADHIILIGLINQLYEAMSEGHGEELFETVLGTLKKYTDFHFTREEAFMKEKQYPDYPAHKACHEKLIRDLSNFTERYTLDK